MFIFFRRWRGYYVIVSALDSESSGSGRGHCAMFLGNILYSHSASLHPGVYKNGYRDELLGKPDKMLRGWTSIPSRGSSNTPSRFTLLKPGYAPAVVGHLTCVDTYTTYNIVSSVSIRIISTLQNSVSFSRDIVRDARIERRAS